MSTNGDILFFRYYSKFFRKHLAVSRKSCKFANRILKKLGEMNIEEKKADFMRRFKASRERKAEYISNMEKRMREDYRLRTGQEAESFSILS